MRVRTYFIWLVILFLLNIITVQVIVFMDWHFSYWIWIGIEVLVLVCLLFLYHRIMKPFQLLENGMLLLKEQDFSSRLRTVGQKDADSIIQIFNRMMEQLKYERLHVREQDQLFDLIFYSSPMGIVIMDLDERIQSMNPSAERLLGISFDKSKGNRICNLHFELSECLQKLTQGEVRTVRLNDSNIYRCSRLSFLNKGFRHTFYLIELLTEEVMHAEKKAYEKVIRMISHEVNNTVAGITSALDTIDATLENFSETTDIRGVIQVCIERCYSMSHFITNFSDVVKIPEPSFLRVDLNDVIRKNVQFMEVICNKRHIDIQMQLDTEALWADIDVGLMQQALINIVKNAAESIGNNGTITIRTNASLSLLEIIDTGKGISKEVESRLFTPFFSTKPNGQGVGLMLVREVLQKHHCIFSLRTDNEGLTIFKIQFKAV